MRLTEYDRIVEAQHKVQRTWNIYSTSASGNLEEMLDIWEKAIEELHEAMRAYCAWMRQGTKV